MVSRKLLENLGDTKKKTPSTKDERHKSTRNKKDKPKKRLCSYSTFKDVAGDVRQSIITHLEDSGLLINVSKVNRRILNDVILLFKQRDETSLKVNFNALKLPTKSSLNALPEILIKSFKNLIIRTRLCHERKIFGDPNQALEFAQQFKKLEKMKIFHNRNACVKECKLKYPNQVRRSFRKLFRGNISLKYASYENEPYRIFPLEPNFSTIIFRRLSNENDTLVIKWTGARFEYLSSLIQKPVNDIIYSF